MKYQRYQKKCLLKISADSLGKNENNYNERFLIMWIAPYLANFLKKIIDLGLFFTLCRDEGDNLKIIDSLLILKKILYCKVWAKMVTSLFCLS